MPTTIGSLRRLLLTPSLREVTFATRGFPVTPTPETRRLEAIPQSVICGFEWAIDTTSLWELETRLELVEPEMRGFAYEGAAMACTILDAMRAGRGTHSRDLLRGPGQPHLFLTYIGIGFAMSHLPRPLWRRVVPNLDGSPYHPTMSWLAVDGYGFDKAYFDTRRWVDEQRRPSPYPWDATPGYFLRAIDQGIGRCLWFIHGGQVDPVASAVTKFATERQADLWSGVGLAATFAGGCGADDLASLRRQAGEQNPEYPAHLAQGSVFAAKARTYSGYVPAHCDAAVHALAGMSTQAASALADEAVMAVPAGGPDDRGGPRYERWRAGIRALAVPSGSR